MFVTYGDSIGDLIDDALGALLGGVILLFWTGRGWGTWRVPGAALRGVEPMPTAPPTATPTAHPLRRSRRPVAAAAWARARAGRVPIPRCRAGWSATGARCSGTPST